jgi:uncharacterized membrane protein
MRFEASIQIDASPQRVWEVYSDVERWPDWTPSVTSVERLDTGPFAVGSRARIRQPRLPTTVWTVTELVEGSHFLWEAKGPGLTTVGGHFVVAESEGTQATARLDQLGPGGAVIGLLTAGLTRRYLDMEIAGLKSCAELRA